jgi:DNA-binding NarL/FixJ family response regulator
MKILIVDDHILFREGLAAILQNETDIEIAGLAGSVQEAVETMRAVKPDIILMDFSLPDGTGADATRQILREYPNCKVVFLTISPDDENLFAAIRSGAKGYLLKDMRPAKLIAALRSVIQGESAISRAMTLHLMEELSRTQTNYQPADPALDILTQREKEVLQMVATGGTNQEIANRLFISENTVKYHIHSILSKLNVPDRIAAVRFGRQHGLVK